MLIIGAPHSGKSKFIDYFLDAIVEMSVSKDNVYDVTCVQIEIDKKMANLKFYEAKESSMERFMLSAEKSLRDKIFDGVILIISQKDQYSF